jgi:hypothetical protein
MEEEEEKTEKINLEDKQKFMIGSIHLIKNCQNIFEYLQSM